MKNINRSGKSRIKSRWTAWIIALALVIGAGVIAPTMAVTVGWAEPWDEGIQIFETVKTAKPNVMFTLAGCWAVPLPDENTVWLNINRDVRAIGYDFGLFNLQNNGDVPMKYKDPDNGSDSDITYYEQVVEGGATVQIVWDNLMNTKNGVLEPKGDFIEGGINVIIPAASIPYYMANNVYYDIPLEFEQWNTSGTGWKETLHVTGNIHLFSPPK